MTGSEKKRRLLLVQPMKSCSKSCSQEQMFSIYGGIHLKKNQEVQDNCDWLKSIDRLISKE